MNHKNVNSVALCKAAYLAENKSGISRNVMVALQNQTVVSNICPHILCNYIHTPDMASVSKLVKFEN